MGEKNLTQFSVSYNNAIRLIQERGFASLSSDTGALALREIIERTGIVKWMCARLHDPRDRRRVIYTLEELLLLQFLMISQGYNDQDDVGRLSNDPALRLAGDPRRNAALEKGKALPSQPTMSRFVEIASTEHNRRILRDAVVRLAVGNVEDRGEGEFVIDVDGFPIDVHGNQAGSEHNGLFHRRVYYPLVAICEQTGYVLGGMLRPGNVCADRGALGFVEDIMKGCAGAALESVIVRMDAGFCGDKMLRGLERLGFDYLTRIKSNARLKKMAEPYLYLPPGVWAQCHDMPYEAESWERERRVVLVVVRREGKLFPDHFWLVTSLSCDTHDADQVLALYRRRGTAEGHIGELKNVVHSGLSCSDRPKSHYGGRALEPRAPVERVGVHPRNETLFLFSLLSYQFMNMGRRMMEEAEKADTVSNICHREIEAVSPDILSRIHNPVIEEPELELGGWSLRRFRERVLLVASRVVRHARRLYFVIASCAVERWNKLWTMMDRVRWVGG